MKRFVTLGLMVWACAIGCGSPPTPVSAPEAAQLPAELPPAGDCSEPMIAGYNDRGHLLESGDPVASAAEYSGAAACGDARGLWGLARDAKALGELGLAVKYSIQAIENAGTAQPPFSEEELNELLAFNQAALAAQTAAGRTTTTNNRPRPVQRVSTPHPDCDIECEDALRGELRQVEGACPDTSDMSIPACARAAEIKKILGEN